MIIGVPKEIMAHEGRVGITPHGVKILVGGGHEVIIERGAGEKSGYSDKDFLEAGAQIKNSSQEIYQADLVVKVKEPQEQEFAFLKKGGIIFAFLHLPANPRLTAVLREKNMIGLTYEGIQLDNGERPALAPMSKIAGQMAVEKGLYYLRHRLAAARTKKAIVMVLGGAGVVGQAAVNSAKKNKRVSMVIALDLPGKLKPAQRHNYQTAVSDARNIGKFIKEVDLLIGAVAIPGGRAEKLVSEKMVASMKKGSVIVDVAIDESGCVETSKPTTHDNPTFTVHGVVHYCVKNMPGAVPKKSTPALTKATLPYLLEIAEKGAEKALKENSALAKGAHVFRGKITNQRLAEVFSEQYTPLGSLL